MKKIAVLLLAAFLLFSFGCSDDDAAATYSVTYDANGADSGAVPVDPAAYSAGSDVTVLDNTNGLTKPGYSFGGWNSTADGSGTNLSAGATFEMPASNVTLYAQWTVDQYTVTFDSQDADTAADPASISVDYNSSVSSLPSEPVKADYTFGGWYTAVDGAGSEFTASTAVTEDVTVYAWWKYDFSAVTYRDMVSVPGGTFTQEDLSGNSFEHTISGFKIGKYEVTYELWYTVYSWATNNGYTFANAGKEGNDGNAGAAPTSAKLEPVTYINWRDAMVWCNAYSQMAGLTPVYYSDSGKTTLLKDSSDGSYGSSINTNAGSYDNPYVNWSADGYRLPTEGEWQYAASYQDGTNWTPPDYASGASADYNDATATGAVAWYGDNSGYKTHAVGTGDANQLDIHDMSGNMYEWCWDWKDDYPSGSQSDYCGAAFGSFRINRGGDFTSLRLYLQVGNRNSSDPSSENNRYGLRVARSGN